MKSLLPTQIFLQKRRFAPETRLIIAPVTDLQFHIKYENTPHRFSRVADRTEPYLTLLQRSPG